jgi:hypothetical protein
MWADPINGSVRDEATLGKFNAGVVSAESFLGENGVAVPSRVR